MVENDSLNVIHPRAAGLDIHKVQITATVRVARAGKDADVWTRQFSAFPTGIGELVEWLKGHRVSAALMEGTGIYWEAPFEALEEAGITPILVHAQHVKQIKGRKTDIADSIWLARICSFGLCSPSMVPPRAFRSLRKVSRMRRQVVRERARARNRIHKILDASGVRVSGILSDLFGANGMRILRGLVDNVPRETILASLTSHVRRHVNQLCDVLTAELDDCSIFLLRDQLEAFDDATRRLERYDEVINDGLAEHHDQINLMMTIPGINRASACAILIEIGPDITVFSSRRQIAAWAGLCPGNNESAGKRRSGRTRRGNTTLREVLIECAQGAARTRNCQFRGYHKGLTVRRGYCKASVATAHKMLRVIYSVLKSGVPYHDPETDYEAAMVQRNAQRWITMLKKHGIDPTTWSGRTRTVA